MQQPVLIWIEHMPTFYSGNTTGSALPVEYYTDYFSEIYYNAAENASQFVWTAPYYDPVSQTVYITAGAPMFNGTTFIGTAGVDIQLNFCQQSILNMTASFGNIGNGYMFMIDNAHGEDTCISRYKLSICEYCWPTRIWTLWKNGR